MNDYTNEIEEIRRRIDSLEAERRDLLGRLSILESKHQQQQREALQQFSSEEKIYIFRQLFRGREDVFPKRWDNRKTGRSGYSPACSNEWVSESPRVCRRLYFLRG